MYIYISSQVLQCIWYSSIVKRKSIRAVTDNDMFTDRYGENEMFLYLLHSIRLKCMRLCGNGTRKRGAHVNTCARSHTECF